jgi:asparagine synthase (glutamine-hydrolysing)
MLEAAPYLALDGAEIWTGGDVGLGAGRLSLTPEDATSAQPVADRQTGCVAVADARLDNRPQLALRLGVEGPLPADAGLILLAYEAWGEEVGSYLLGDFVFIIWDPARRALVCGRDPTVQRRLFYHHDGRRFLVASELHQLFQDPSVPIRPNEARILDELTPLNMVRNLKDSPVTFFEDIKALPAGHLLTVAPGHFRLRPYYRLRPATVRYRRDEDYAEHFRALFFNAVRDRLRSARPIGIMLSGGLDSGSVACVAKHLRAEDPNLPDLVGFNFYFEGLPCDERPLVEEVARLWGLPIRYLAFTGVVPRLQPEPEGFYETPNAGLTEARDILGAAAAEAGVRVILSGETADSYVGGSWLVFDSLLKAGKFGTFFEYFRRYRRVAEEPLRTTVALYCFGPLLPIGLQRRLMALYTTRAVGRNPRLLPGWIPDSLRAALRARHLSLCLDLERGRHFPNPTLEAEYRLLHPPEAVWDLGPWPVQVWRPFADVRLHEFMLGVPPEQKFRPHPQTDEYYAGSKWLLRRAMEGILPEAVRTRTAKTQFGPAFRLELGRNWPAYAAVFGPGGNSEVGRRGYIVPELFWERLVMLREGVEDLDLLYVLKIVGLETWLRSLRQPRPKILSPALTTNLFLRPPNLRAERPRPHGRLAQPSAAPELKSP